ncbi:MAG: monovalent cation:proton antiporter-2 (CPA2) family protein [Pseudomonadota bacterium]
MAAPGLDPFLLDAVTYLGAAVVAVPLFKKLKLGSVVGYLAAGAVIGPHGIGLVEDAETVLHFAEFGVVLLLFVIGLELQPTRLWRLRGEIFGLGALQVGITGVLIAAILLFGGILPLQPAIAIAGALALSSTAFAIQILREKGDLTKPYGDRAFSILLFQDLSIVPLLALVAVLSPFGGGVSGGDPWLQAAIAIGSIAGLIVVGHFGLGPLFRIIAATKSDEIFTATGLLIVAASALLMQWAGLSMAMGAFLAGVLLAESEFRHQLEGDIEPFRGLFLGLLFIAVGMSVAWGIIWDNLLIVIAGALGLLAVKSAVLVGLTRAFGSPWPDALKIGALLGQGGEFGFVIFTVASGTAALINLFEASLLTAIVTATMALTPVMLVLAERLGAAKQGDEMAGIDTAEDAEEAPVIVAGFGRFGQIVARILRLRGYDLVLIDSSPERIRVAKTFGNKVFFGDVRRADTLKASGVEQAKAIFLCADDPKAVLIAAEKLRMRFPNLKIYARANDRISELELGRAGVDRVMREMLESGVAMARQALDDFGDGDAADEVIEEFRRRDTELLRLQAEHGALGGYQKMRDEFDLRDS